MDASEEYMDNIVVNGGNYHYGFQEEASSDATPPPSKDDLGDMMFCMSNYAKEMLKMMYMMRSHHMLTDVILEVENELFHAHKIVLSSASPYFKAMFTGGLKECDMHRVKLQGVSFSFIKSSFSLISGFSHSGLSHNHGPSNIIHVHRSNQSNRSDGLPAPAGSYNVSSSQCN